MINNKEKNKNRERIVIKTSVINIMWNLFIASVKGIIGFFTNSIAITSDAINSLVDSLSGIITILGIKYASKLPDKKHPYGYGKIEHMSEFLVSSIILYAGITECIESIKKIIHPDHVHYDNFIIVILITAIIIKYILGWYIDKKSKEANSDTLHIAGTHAEHGAIISISVLVSALFYKIFNIKIEGYVGIFLSLMVIKSGFDLIKRSIDNIIEKRIPKKISLKIKEMIMEEREVQGVYDLILNSAGYDKYHGSVHIEVSDDLSITEADILTRKITKKVYEKFGIVIHTIGIYAINTHNKEIISMREKIKETILKYDGTIDIHGFVVDNKNKTCSFDIVIDFSILNRKIFKDLIIKELVKIYPGYTFEIILDTDISD